MISQSIMNGSAASAAFFSKKQTRKKRAKKKAITKSPSRTRTRKTAGSGRAVVNPRPRGRVVRQKAKSNGKRLVKGSPAAKRRMKQLRAMQKRNR